MLPRARSPINWWRSGREWTCCLAFSNKSQSLSHVEFPPRISARLIVYPLLPSHRPNKIRSCHFAQVSSVERRKTFQAKVSPRERQGRTGEVVGGLNPCCTSSDIGSHWPLTRAPARLTVLPTNTHFQSSFPITIVQEPVCKSGTNALGVVPYVHGGLTISDIFKHERNWLIVYPGILFPKFPAQQTILQSPLIQPARMLVAPNGNKVRFTDANRKSLYISCDIRSQWERVVFSWTFGEFESRFMAFLAVGQILSLIHTIWASYWREAKQGTVNPSLVRKRLDFVSVQKLTQYWQHL